MKSRDITLTSNLIGLYIAVLVLQATTPLNVSAVMFSALFGIFWNYFSTKRNLAIQIGRILYNLSAAIYGIPKIIAMLRGQAIAGIAFLDWLNAERIESTGIQYLEIIGKGNPTIALWIFAIIYASFMSVVVSYAFYRFFRWKGVFKRLPSF